MKYLYFNIIVVIILSLLSCHSPGSNANITIPLSRSDYRVNIEAEGELDAVRSHVLVTPRIRYIAKLTWLLPEGSRVGKDELVYRLEADELQNQYLTAIDQLEIVKADAVAKNAELELQQLLYETQYRNAMASVKAAQLQLAKLEFEPPKIQEIKKLEIARYEVEAKQSSQKMSSLEKIQAEERAHMELLIRQAENKVAVIKESMDLMIVKSPVDGLVIYEENWMTDEKLKPGDQVFPGMPIIKIPDMSAMQVILQLGESDAQRVKKGHKAAITVPTLDNLVLPGRVTSVDKVAKPIRRGSKVRKVEVIVAIDSLAQALLPGLTARCRIETGLLENVISVPLDCVFEKDSVKLVYIGAGKKFIPRPVAVISQDEDYAIIEGDFKGDEMIALLAPPAASVIWPARLTARKSQTSPVGDTVKTVPDSLAGDKDTPGVANMPVIRERAR
ncbi:MAG TPA: efflux RND transporter periplasmic adaptor subunit [bacterium]|nr:efflux RND transporter periplasmic adaptor subunit [bacterium]HPN42330.1 efflux RND transporter periplasmic adaptor subunit [bacterium]